MVAWSARLGAVGVETQDSSRRVRTAADSVGASCWYSNVGARFKSRANLCNDGYASEKSRPHFGVSRWVTRPCC